MIDERYKKYDGHKRVKLCKKLVGMPTHASREDSWGLIPPGGGSEVVQLPKDDHMKAAQFGCLLVSETELYDLRCGSNFRIIEQVFPNWSISDSHHNVTVVYK